MTLRPCSLSLAKPALVRLSWRFESDLGLQNRRLTMNLESKILITEKTVDSIIRNRVDSLYERFDGEAERILIDMLQTGCTLLEPCMKTLEEFKKIKAADGQIPYQNSRQILPRR